MLIKDILIDLFCALSLLSRERAIPKN